MGQYKEKAVLERLYIKEKKSVSQTAVALGCSEHSINYWLRRHGIAKRTISEAIYERNNPGGDPFCFSPPRTLEDKELFGLGIGLYWGEGNKANKASVRIGNSDPALLRMFMQFLEKLFNVKRKDMRFQLQIYDDVDLQGALHHWTHVLRIDSSQWMKSFVSKSTKLGTYRHKNAYGVVTLYYHNVKLRNLLVDMLAKRGGLCVNYSAHRPGSSVGRATPW